MSRTIDSHDAENRPGSRYGLALASAFLLTIAVGVWQIRAGKSALRVERTQNQARIEAAVAQARTSEKRDSQHAASLLIRSFLAEKQLSYSALAQAWATYAGKEMNSTARIVRAPDAMAISYIKGAREGLTSGYNQRWMWRQKDGAPLEAYAEMAREEPSVVAKRLSLMLDNYSVSRVREDSIGGRAVEVLEIKPLKPIDGARGPGKYLSIDKATGLALATETFDHQWQRTMKSSLSELNLKPTITAQTFASPGAMSEAAKRKTWMARDMGSGHDAVARETGWVPPTPKYLPPGFAFDSVGVHHCGTAPAASGIVAAMARYTDGLNTLSVFAMPELKSSDLSASPEQVCDFGSGTLVSRRDAARKGFIIVVADLPLKTLKRVADSTSLQPSKR